MQIGFPSGSEVKKPPAILEAQEIQVRSLGREDPLRKWQPNPVFLPGESHEQRSLVCYSPYGHKDQIQLKPLNMHAGKQKCMYRTVFWTLWERERVG